MNIVKLSVTAAVIAGLAACAGTSNKPLTAEGLFARHVEVAYGGKGMGVHPSAISTGTLFIESFGIEAPITTKTLEPGNFVFETNVMGMAMSQGCNASGCWSQQPGAGITPLSGEQLDFFRQQADGRQFEHIGDYYDTLELVASDNPDAKDYKVRAVNKYGRENFYYFAKDTGLLSGTDITMDSEMGVMTQHTTLTNYQNFDGVLMAKETLQSSSMADVKVVLDNVSFVPLTEKDFMRPE